MKLDKFLPNQNRHVRFLLGLYINRKRQEFGFSIPEFAEQSTLSPATIKRIESGRKKMTTSEFIKIQTHLELLGDDLVEIHKIASVAYINDLSKAIVPNYPL